MCGTLKRENIHLDEEKRGMGRLIRSHLNRKRTGIRVVMVRVEDRKSSDRSFFWWKVECQ
jgi:hypothetical protein